MQIDHITLLQNFKVDNLDYFQKRASFYDGKNVVPVEDKIDGSRPSFSNFSWVKLICDQLAGFVFADVIDYNLEDKLDFVDFRKESTLDITDSQSYARCLLYGSSIETVLYNEDHIEIKSYDPMNWQLIRDEFDNIIYAIYKMRLPLNSFYNDQYVTKQTDLYIIFDDTNITKYTKNARDKKFNLVSQIPHKMTQTPVIELNINDSGYSIISDNILQDVNNFNVTKSLFLDDVKYNNNSLLVITGFQQNQEEEKDPETGKTPVQEAVQEKHIFLPPDGDAKFLTKGADNAKYESLIDLLRQDLHAMSSTIDAKDISVAGVSSGIALMLKFEVLANASNKFCSYFKLGIQKRFELVNIIRNRFSQPEYILNSISFIYKFSTDEIEVWQNIGKLKDLGVPVEELIKLIPSLRNMNLDLLKKAEDIVKPVLDPNSDIQMNNTPANTTPMSSDNQMMTKSQMNVAQSSPLNPR
jgi:SPP1 family phage portal protein